MRVFKSGWRTLGLYWGLRQLERGRGLGLLAGLTTLRP